MDINEKIQKFYYNIKFTKKNQEKQLIDYLFVYHITNFTGWDADIYFEDLSKTFSSQKIVVAGTVVHQIQRNFSNVILLKSDKVVYDFVQQLN